MPLIDMPLEQLKTYRGSSPRPADFDEYWDRALAELDAQDSRVELIPASFQAPGAECFDLWFTGVGGSRVHCQYLRPAGEQKPHPAVLMFHGYGGSAGDWNNKLAYVLAGYSVAAMDVRGQGGKSEDLGSVVGTTQTGHFIRGLDGGPEKLLFRSVYLDTAQLARIVMALPEVDEHRVGCMGGSQGGALTIACASLEPRIKQAAPQYPFLCDFKRVWDMDLARGAYGEIRSYFRNFDPRHEREDEVFTTLGYIDLQYLAPRIQADVLMFTGLMDTTCPPSTQFAAYNRMTCRKQVVIYPDFDHEHLPDHLDMVYQWMMEL